MKDSELTVELTRLHNFLDQNQLVQANAIAQKIEASLEALLTPCPAVDQHRLFPVFRSVNKIKSFILSGKTEQALAEVKGLVKS